jgi:outer membrane protein TolC
MQDVEGNIQEISRGSIYSGLGAQAVGAGSPAVPGLLVNFHFRDAIFQPRIAERTLAARREAGQAALQDLLSETAVAYINLLESVQNRAIGIETTANLQALSDLTASYSRTGAGLASDADRVRTELLLQQIEGRRAEENVQVASARLMQLLSQDPTLAIEPQEASLAPLEIVRQDLSLAELVATGLVNRPELAESRFLAAAAVERLRRERAAPLVPSVLLGVSYGTNVGGVGGTMDNFGDRLDLDAVAWWEIRNFGFGEHAARDVAQSQLAQARWQQARLLDQVASEVVQSHAQVAIRQTQIALAQQGITAAGDSYRRNTDRIRNGQGLPIEALQSVQALGAAQRQYVRAVADYNRAQFQLQRALGWPVGWTAAEP